MAGQIPEKPGELTPDPNPIIVKWTKGNGYLEKETTHAEPKVHRESFSIAQARARIAKRNGVIAIWQAKNAPDQALIDQYEAL